MKIQQLIKIYLLSHIRNCIACMGTMWREPWGTIVTTLVIGIALALPTGLMVLITNAQKINATWNNGVQLSVVLKPSTTDAIIKNKHVILQHKNITNLRFISPKEALTDFEQATGQTNLLQYLDENPLPPILIINLKSKLTEQEIKMLMQQVQQWPETEHIQLDKSWLQRLNSLLKLADHLVIITTIILALAVFLVTGNTIRLNVEKKKRHIIITRLVGATNAFIRREFLYLGCWYGLLGGIVALLIVAISITILKNPVNELAALYQSNFVLTGLDSKNSCTLLILSMTLGISSAWVSVGTYLDKLELE